jgi:hypothetical protein
MVNSDQEGKDMSPRQIARFCLLLVGLTSLVFLPSSVLVPIAQSVQSDCPANTTIVHVVSRGENLFRIAIRYNTTVAAIAAVNGITDTGRIFVGQRLIIPCGLDSVVPLPAPVLVAPAVGTCGGFRLTSPLDGLPFGGVTFYWEPAPGATSYQLNIYQEADSGRIDGPLRLSYVVAAPSTSLSADVGWPLSASGIWFSWEVHAFFGGQVICSTPRWSIWRGPGPTPIPPANISQPPPPGPFCGDDICEENENCEVCSTDCGECDF